MSIQCNCKFVDEGTRALKNQNLGKIEEKPRNRSLGSIHTSLRRTSTVIAYTAYPSKPAGMDRSLSRSKPSHQRHQGQ